MSNNRMVEQFCHYAFLSFYIASATIFTSN